MVERNKRIQQLGNIFSKKRAELSLEPNTREHFLTDREEKGLIPENAISIKTLFNIENGYNVPSLQTIKVLSIALEVDHIELIKQIYPFIPVKRSR